MLLGADPEFFAQDATTGVYLPASAIGLKNGKYDQEERWTDPDGHGIQIYRDGYGAEVNFTVPHYCRGLMGNAFKAGMKNFLAEKPDIRLSTIPTIPVKLEEIRELPADVAQFGCAPSKNAWGEKLDISKVNGLEHPFRYSGGHMWLSNSFDEHPWLKDDLELEKFIRALDYYLGLPFTYIFERPEAFQRRKMYGRAGDYRTKDFSVRTRGLEYRVLSAEWFNHTAWFSFVLGVARFLATRFKYINHGGILERGAEIQAAINEGVNLEGMLPARLFGFYTKEALQACKERQGKFDFTFTSCPDTHSGWDHWSNTWRLPGDWGKGSSLDFKLAA